MKPKILVELETGNIIKWGYRDFSQETKAGKIEQIEIEDKPSPLPDVGRFCRYNFKTKKVEKKTDSEIEIVENEEALIQAEMRNLAIESLKKKGKI